MLQLLVIPACFIGAGFIGLWLGTPRRVVGGLLAVGGFHVAALLIAPLALDAGAAAAWTHLASQMLFLAGFVGLVWLAAAYPDSRPPTSLMVAATLLSVAGPVLAAASDGTPSIVDGDRLLGPVVSVLPPPVASIAAAPLLLLPLMTVVVFVTRAVRATREERAAMRWPAVGAGLLLIAVGAGTLAPAPYQGVVTAVFLLTAPLLPLSLAFGPVNHRIETMKAALEDAQHALSQHARFQPQPDSLAQLTPREYSVLEAMARGDANPVIARTLHLSLSSVEKHVTSIFRKLGIDDSPSINRRVAAVMVYSKAHEGAAQQH